ncbi:hypothetical protein BN1183_AY_00880 [Pantoea ananatis]|nr:hypothetical protein [Pantoea ananatis]CRH33940.1 hypothetical protein BN1183_AY_00880 [Pantoea ananatis]
MTLFFSGFFVVLFSSLGFLSWFSFVVFFSGLGFLGCFSFVVFLASPELSGLV